MSIVHYFGVDYRSNFKTSGNNRKRMFSRTTALSWGVTGLGLITGVLIVFCTSYVKKTPLKIEIVSAMRIYSFDNIYGIANYSDDENGLIVIVKKTSAGTAMVHSTDFAVAFESATAIPRRPLIGISRGMKSPTDKIAWFVTGTGRSIFRNCFEKASEPYFALLFMVPKDVDTFSLYQSIPISTPFLADQNELSDVTGRHAKML